MNILQLLRKSVMDKLQKEPVKHGLTCISLISVNLFGVELHVIPKDTVYCGSELLIIY